MGPCLAALALALSSVLSSPGSAEPEAAKSLPAPGPSATERVHALFKAQCAECYQDRFGNVLGLDELAEDLHFVVPGRPDASLVYRRMLAGLPPFGPPATDAGPAPGFAPAAADTEAVRDWIASLPARDEGCRDRKPFTPADAETVIGRWIETVGVAEAADTRFVSLADLWNACISPARIKEARDAVGALFAALARHRDPPHMETLGEANAVIAVRTSELAMLKGEWERLTAGAPPATTAGAVPADWLASRVLSGVKTASGTPDPAFDVRFDGAGQRAVAALARGWDRDLDLVRAAGEWGVDPHTLKERLAAIGGDLELSAARLSYGVVSRAAWSALQRALDAADGEAVSRPAQPAPETSGGIDVVLWPDRPSYTPRDIATFYVTVSAACHLTLINVDRTGKAIVLFPNELEPDNLIAPKVRVRVPGAGAGYQLRFDRAGEEEFVAICQRTSRRPDGIVYDHEKQRFAILGDWRTFLRTAPERIAAMRGRAGTDESPRRRRRDRAPAEKEAPPIDAAGPAIEGRTAIVVTVDLAGSH